jgi:hypothetical protein
MSSTIQIKSKFQLSRVGRGAPKIIAKPKSAAPVIPGRLPRITRMLALAHRFDNLLRAGVVRDQAELANLGHVTRSRITQILSLLQLAPDIQETILFLPRIQYGREPVKEHELRNIAADPDWQVQRKQWSWLADRYRPS